MRALHERFLDEIGEERRRRSSRRGLLVGSAKLAGGGLLAFGGGLGTGRFALAQALEDNVDVLNYALTLERLEAAFYNVGLDTFSQGDFDAEIFNNIVIIRDHEMQHVATLSETVTMLGGSPVEEQEYDFGDAFADPAAFLETGAVLENTGVQAYDGAAQFLTDPDLLTAAGGIVAVEARHAAYLNELNDLSPFPDAVETPLPPDDVRAAIAPFIEGA